MFNQPYPFCLNEAETMCDIIEEDSNCDTRSCSLKRSFNDMQEEDPHVFRSQLLGKL